MGHKARPSQHRMEKTKTSRACLQQLYRNAISLNVKQTILQDVTFGESRNEGCRNMLSSGTAGRGTLLLLTITLVCRRGKYGPSSPEIMWQHLINVQPSCGLLLIPPSFS